MSNESYLTQYHYVYRITNVILKKHYYGSRTSRIIPQLDLGVKYLSSSRDTQFKQDQKENPQNYRYKVVSIHPSRVSAIEKEIRLHQKFDVGVNPNFYNRSKQTSTKYDVTGMRCVIDNSTKEMKFVAKNHSKILSGEYVGLTQGFITAREVATGKTLSVPKDDPRFKTGELVGVANGCKRVYDSIDMIKMTCMLPSDPRYMKSHFPKSYWVEQLNSERNHRIF